MNPLRRVWYPALSSAASRYSDSRLRAGGHAPGSPLRVAAADAMTSLWDLRAAHTLACGHTPGDLQPNGVLRPGVRAASRRPSVG